MAFPASVPATLLVMIGGALGAAGRYHLGRLIFQVTGPGWPAGTLAANVLGGAAMGLLIGWMARQGVDSPNAESWRLLIGVGLLGGFTTFSAFSLESYMMLARGEIVAGLGYIAVSVLAAIGALWGGLLIGRSVFA